MTTLNVSDDNVALDPDVAAAAAANADSEAKTLTVYLNEMLRIAMRLPDPNRGGKVGHAGGGAG